MKRINTYVCVIIAAVLLLASCSMDSKKDDNNKNQTVTLMFSTFYEEGAEAEGYKEIIKAFEDSHQNIKVNLQAGGTNYDEKVSTAMQMGNGPDIIGLQRQNMISYARKGELKDLSSWIESQGLKDKYYGVSTGYGKFDNKYYGIGDLPQTVEWFYNPALFKKAGVKEPTNLDELINACNKLKRYTQTPIAIGAKDDWALDTFFGIISGQTINTQDFGKAYSAGDGNSLKNLSGADEALNILRQLVKSGAIGKKSMSYSYANAVDAFVKGKAAILPMGSWAVDKIEKVKPKSFSYKVFKAPLQLTENPISSISATTLQVISVNAKTKHEKEAMEFMTYLFSSDAQKIFAQKNGFSGMKSANNASEDSVKQAILDHLDITNENSTMYIDNVTPRMMNTTGVDLLKFMTGKLELNKTWDLIIDESHS